jgi:hypothetical protein
MPTDQPMQQCPSRACRPGLSLRQHDPIRARYRRITAGAAPITRASGKTRSVTHRRAKNQRLATAGYLRAFSALTVSPGARSQYDRRRADGDRHAAAQRNLLGRLLSCLHHCLTTGQHYDENTAFPPSAPATPSIAA